MRTLPCPWTPTKQPRLQQNTLQRHHKMTWTSQSQAALPAPCCKTLKSFTSSHEMFVSPTLHTRSGGSYSPPSTTTTVLTPDYKIIIGRACLLLIPDGQFIATYVNSGVTHKLSLHCAVSSPPLTIHGGHLNQLVSSHSQLINKATITTGTPVKYSSQEQAYFVR